MSTAATEDYVAKRAKLLATLVLTRQKDVHPLDFHATEDVGIDLIVVLPSIGESKYETPVRISLGVEVMGTDDSLETETAATAYANQHREDRPAGFFLGPIVLLLFSMDGDKGYFSWIMEPKVTKAEGPTLTRVSSLDMTKITKTSTEIIFHESAAWFEAMFQILLRDKKSK
jgi:hypothetical protein